MNKHEYRFISEPTESPEKLVDRKIEKTGLTSIFTLRQCLTHRAKLKKQIEELEAQMKVDAVVLEKIEGKMPQLKDFTNDETTNEVLGRYFKGRERHRVSDKAIENCKKALEQYEEEIPEIAKQLGINEQELNEDTQSTPTPEGR